MDRIPLKEALEKAQLVVASHGMMNYMPQYSKNSLSNSVEGIDRLTYEYLLHPSKSSYNNDNFSCTLCIAYNCERDEERAGGIYRDYNSRVSIRMGTGDMTLAGIKIRENMIASLTMLMEMIEIAIPKRLTVTVMSPEDLREKRQREHEQTIASKIFSVVGKSAVKNLRVGGRPRTIRLPDNYAETNGSMPDVGRYRFDQIRYVNRHGQIKDRATFIFSVSKSYDGSYTMLKIWRTA